MKIIIVATHSFPIPYKTHTGDVVILNLADALAELGHDVSIAAPLGTQPKNNKVKVLNMKASYGAYPPSAEECEQECFNKYRSEFLSADIVHDFSVAKTIVTHLNYLGKRNTLCTLMGGAWTHAYPPNNLCVWSKAHRDRVLRGATDYEGTPTPDLAGPPQKPVKEAHVVYGGIDTEFYYPTYQKKDYILWMGRWSKVRGYVRAIEIAKANPHVNFVFSGGKPENEYFAQEKQCAEEAIKLASQVPNIKIDLLPPDPDHHIAKRKLYQEAKAFLYSVQFCEPFGLMQAESLACGTPVIGTNYGSVPEVITDGITGYVRNNTIEDLSKVIDIIDNISPENCRKAAVERFDIKIMASSYLNEYQAIINGSKW